MNKHFTMYTDGGSRGNPGLAAIAGYILDTNNSTVVEFKECIGVATNNSAEYSALIKGLSLAIEKGVLEIECIMDSELAVKQLNGIYKVKDENIKKLYLKVRELMGRFEGIKFRHVMRSQNKLADKMVNIALDGDDKKS